MPYKKENRIEKHWTEETGKRNPRSRIWKISIFEKMRIPYKSQTTWLWHRSYSWNQSTKLMVYINVKESRCHIHIFENIFFLFFKYSITVTQISGLLSLKLYLYPIFISNMQIFVYNLWTHKEILNYSYGCK